MARTPVSDEMWNNNPIVLGLRHRLGPALENAIGSVQVGHLKVSATDSMHNQGFLLTVYSPANRDRTASIFTIKKGTYIQTPLLEELEKRLPNHHAELAAYADLLERWGCELGRSGNKSRHWPRLEEVTLRIMADLDEFSACAQALANPSAGSS